MFGIAEFVFCNAKHFFIMNYLHKEVRFLEKEIVRGSPSGDSIIQTRYDFELRIDPLGRSPALMINTFTRVLYSEVEAIASFGCMAVFFFENENQITIEIIVKLTKEIKPEIDDIFKEKCSPEFNLPVYEIEQINEKREYPKLKKLVLSGFRSN